MRFLYQRKGTCEVCGRKALCLWRPTGPFEGKWLCGRCAPPSDYGEGLADLVKVMGRQASETEGGG